MDQQTYEHLIAWLARSVHECERGAVFNGITRFVAEYPDILDTRSWPEIRELAERGGYMEAAK